MHPAPSIILFTILSGFGFGVIAWVGFLLFLEMLSMEEIFVYYIIGGFLSVSGLISSTFHLANKKNAIKSFSQWRSSWLSREAVVSVICLIFVGINLVWILIKDESIPQVGLAASALALITVFTTSMIYAQLKSVPAWNTALTPVLFLFSSSVGGSILLLPDYALFFLIIFIVVQVLFWISNDLSEQKSKTNISTALGFKSVEKIRSFDLAHTNQNYLLNEMVYKIGRKHSRKLRYISILLGALVPLLLLSFIHSNNYFFICSVCALHLFGLYFSRWLFFAEAKHVVSFYYDA